jgi:hypothetical protein
MSTANRRTAVNHFPAIAGLLLGLLALVLVAVHVRAARSNTRALNQECRDEAAEFGSEADNVVAGSKVVGYKTHYNLQRRQCLVDITSSRSENGGTYSKEQIFDPKDGTFIASCDRLSGASQTSAIVLGAPVPIQRESTAQAWFNDLMRK